MAIFSLVIYFIACFCFGRLLQRLCPHIKLTISENFILGSGGLALVTFLLALPGVLSLRLISLAVIGLSLTFAIVLYAPSLPLPSLRRIDRDKVITVTIFCLLLIPLSLILLHIPPYGDSLVNWSTVVKDMIFYDDLPRQGQLSASDFQSYPILPRLLVVNGLALLGKMHGGAGRIVMFILSSTGTVFIYEVLRKHFSVTASTIVATGIHLLVFASAFRWYTSWYPEGPFAVILLISSYRLVTAFSEAEPPSWSKIIVVSILMMMLVALRPDGYLFLLLLFSMGMVEIIGWNTNFAAKIFRLVVSFLAPVSIYGLWQAHSIINHFPAQKPIRENLNPIVPIIQSILQQLVTRWYVLGPLVISIFVALILAVVLFKRLDKEEKALLLILLVPVYRALTLVAAFAITFSSGEAARPGFLFERYMLEAGFATFFVCGLLCLKTLKLYKTIPDLKLLSYVGLVSIMVLHLGIGVLWSAMMPIQDYHRIDELVTTLKSAYPDMKVIQVVDQDGPDFLTGLVKYYASPEIAIVGHDTIGRPISDSIYWHINPRREAGGIQSTSQYLDYLHQHGITGILILDSDAELERILGTTLEKDKLFLLRVEERGIITQWTIPKPVFDAPEGPSFDKAVRKLWNLFKAIL